MEIKFEFKNIEKDISESDRVSCEAALDKLWNSQWINRSINGKDRQELEPIGSEVERLRALADLMVVIGGTGTGCIKALTDAMPERAGGGELIIFEDTLSPAIYAGIIEKLEEENFCLFFVAPRVESLQQRAFFTAMKKLLVDRYGGRGAAERILVAADEDNQYITDDAKKYGYSLLTLYSGYNYLCLSNTVAALIPLGFKGADLDKYLEGHFQMVSSPSWDLDGINYSIISGASSIEEILIWQGQYMSIGQWLSDFNTEIQKKSAVIGMPCRLVDTEGSLKVLILSEEDDEDIVIPPFEGCNEDGSLACLLKEECDGFYDSISGSSMRISWRRMDENILGQLAAYIQISKGITEFLIKN